MRKKGKNKLFVGFFVHLSDDSTYEYISMSLFNYNFIPIVAYTNSLVKTNLFNANFTNTKFDVHTMKLALNKNMISG